MLICAIARTEYLTDYLTKQVKNVSVLAFEDHHYFSKYDVAQLKTNFDQIETNKKITDTVHSM